MLDLRRRQFLNLLGSVAAAWPLAARAQQGERVQQASQGTRLAALARFRQGLNEIGLTSWTCRSQTARRNGRFVAQQTVENR
jgi:hypothetical protein